MSDEKNLELETQEENTPKTPVEEPKSKTQEVSTPETPIEESKLKTTPVESTTDDDDEEDEITEEEEAVEEVSAHDDFDWSIGNQQIHTYSKEEIEKYLIDYEKSLNSVSDNDVVKGKVSSISSGDVVLDINYKSDGLVSLSEFRDMPELTIGDEVDVYIEQKEDDRGQLILSRKKAKLLRAWELLVDSYTNGTIIKGHIVSKTKGGLIADCNGLETFLPGSQIDIKPIIDYDSYVGKVMEFRVVKINEAIKNAVISHKALIESDLAEQREMIISHLEKGQVLEGIVKNITDFGAFMDLGGVDGLLYITDISWGRINHPGEVLELNQKLNVVVLDFDEEKKRISLGLKQLQPHPWDILEESVKESSVVKGKIVNIEDYGAFLEITPGVEGLIHVSEVSWSNQPVNAREFFQLNQEFEAKIVTIDRDERKMSLSIKQLIEDPWSKIAEKFPVNSKHTGEVKNLTPYGVFVELEEGIGGMVHISDLSWTKRFSHPSEFTKVGEKIDVMILEIDQENRKLSLGHKQIEENPWDTFESVFPIGSLHESTIIRKDDRGAIVLMPYGLEAFAPSKHLRKEDGSFAELEETLPFKVIEFNRDDKRILVSHLRHHEDVKRDHENDERRKKGAEEKKTQQAIDNQSSKIERTTLGELDVFSQLKDQLQENAEKASKAKKAAKKEVETIAEKPKAKAKPKSGDKGDDLKKIEGIGPKISEILTSHGMASFAELSKAKADDIKAILEEAGSRYKMHDPSTWPQQAELAAADKWDELKELQDQLKGGK